MNQHFLNDQLRIGVWKLSANGYRRQQGKLNVTMTTAGYLERGLSNNHGMICTSLKHKNCWGKGGILVFAFDKG